MNIGMILTLIHRYHGCSIVHVVYDNCDLAILSWVHLSLLYYIYMQVYMSSSLRDFQPSHQMGGLSSCRERGQSGGKENQREHSYQEEQEVQPG